jgi:SAM-dependent methyltransferase
MSEPNLYVNSAAFYDLDPRPIQSADIGFFVNRCSRAQERALELACGTGRLTIPIAKSGIRIDGLDRSEAMLNLFAGKLRDLPPEVSARIRIQQGNMASFCLPARFDVIFIPFRSFQLLTTREEQLSCLRCARAHLRTTGQFIIAVFRPSEKLDQTWIAPPAIDWDLVDSSTGRRIVRRHVRRRIDVERQILEVDLLFSVDGKETFSDQLQLSYFYPSQLEALLREAGFTLVESMGDYDGRPIGEGGELIYVCKGEGA